MASGRNPAGRFILFAAKFLDKMIDQDGDIAPALAQRRDAYGNDIQPVIQILSEIFLFAPIL